MKRIHLSLGALIHLAIGFGVLAQPAAGPWWPYFHGPNRDNISRETGLLKTWPQAGPPLLWKFDQCGQGFSMVSIANGTIFTAGDFDDDEYVMALDLNGKLKWKSPNGKAWKGEYPGSRTTPTFDDGVVYHEGPHGRLAAFGADSGKEVWAVDLRDAFGARKGAGRWPKICWWMGSGFSARPAGARA